MTIDRRTVVGGLAIGIAAAASARAAFAAPPAALFAGTRLADNRLARTFARVDLPLPDVVVLNRNGRQRLTQLAGRARLLTLWAEWCVPCLLEARDLAAAQPHVAGGAFNVVSVLTASSAKLDYAGAMARLHKAGADGLTLLVEPDGGFAIAQALSVQPMAVASRPGHRPAAPTADFSLPCTLLVDRHGRVRGRSTGIASTSAPDHRKKIAIGHVLTEAEKHAMMADGTRTAWSTPDGAAFLQALHDGALDRI